MNQTETGDNDASVSKLVRDFKTVVADAESLLKATAGDLGERAKDARERLSTSLESAKGNFSDWEERAWAGARATDKCIREHPYQTIGAAFGLGLIIGLIVNSRS